MIKLTSKIYVAGHNGLVGSAIVRQLKRKGYKKIITVSKKKLNLLDKNKILRFLKTKKPDFIFIAAAKVGGILANNRYKADFIYENISIQSNLIHSAYLSGIKNLIFLGSSCVYPRNCKQPIKEDYLLTGKLESTNDAYAVAKIAGIKMCESYNDQYKTNYKCLMPSNTFGPNDNYRNLVSHFIPSLIKKIHKMHKTKSNKLILWGSGKPKRELIYVDDIADACVFFMKKRTKHSIINIGTGKDYSIEYYAKKFSRVILKNKKIKIKYDKSKPDGTLRKVMDVSLAKKYGWIAKKDLDEAISETYNSFVRGIKI